MCGEIGRSGCIPFSSPSLSLSLSVSPMCVMVCWMLRSPVPHFYMYVIRTHELLETTSCCIAVVLVSISGRLLFFGCSRINEYSYIRSIIYLLGICICTLYVYIYFYHRTLSALPHDCLPTLEPGTRSRISARTMARGDETPRAHQEGARLAGGGSPRPSGNVYTEAFPLQGPGPPRTDRVWGVASVARSGPGEVL